MGKIDKGDDYRGVYRAIYSSLWEDPEFKKLDPQTKLVFLNLRTGPLSNMPCIFAYYLEAICRQTGLTEGTVKDSLDTLSDTHWIAYQDGYLWIKKALRFDPSISLSNEKHISAIKKVINSLPKIQLVKDFIDFYKLNIPYDIPNIIPYQIPYPIQDKDKDKEPDKDKEQEVQQKPPVDNSPTEDQKHRLNDLSLKAIEKYKTTHFNPYQWLQRHRKANPEALIHTLQSLIDKEATNPWAYCEKILKVENGNYNEQEFQAKAKDNVFTDLIYDIKKLHTKNGRKTCP